MSLFSLRSPDRNAVPVLTEGALKKKAATDKYVNNKKVEDALHDVIRWAIYVLAILGVGGVGYFVYYYQFSDARDPSMLLDTAKVILVYIAGIVTPTINKVLGGQQADE